MTFHHVFHKKLLERGRDRCYLKSIYILNKISLGILLILQQGHTEHVLRKLNFT